MMCAEWDVHLKHARIRITNQESHFSLQPLTVNVVEMFLVSAVCAFSKVDVFGLPMPGPDAMSGILAVRRGACC